MRLVAAHTKVFALELLRLPSFSVPTLAFPAMFFLMFVASRADSRSANLYLASYVGFAVLGVAFFQFGVGIAVERASPWESYVRSLPVRARTRFAARVLAALAFGVGAGACVVLAAVLTTPVSLTPTKWSLLALSVLLGSVPFAFLGIALGYWATPKGALPAANVLFLGLSFAGGLWTTAAGLPEALQALSPPLPTRQFGETLWGSVSGEWWQPTAWLALAGYTVVFAFVAAWGYRRDEGERFR